MALKPIKPSKQKRNQRKNPAPQAMPLQPLLAQTRRPRQMQTPLCPPMQTPPWTQHQRPSQHQ